MSNLVELKIEAKGAAEAAKAVSAVTATVDQMATKTVTSAKAIDQVAEALKRMNEERQKFGSGESMAKTYDLERRMNIPTAAIRDYNRELDTTAVNSIAVTTAARSMTTEFNGSNEGAMTLARSLANVSDGSGSAMGLFSAVTGSVLRSRDSWVMLGNTLSKGALFGGALIALQSMWSTLKGINDSLNDVNETAKKSGALRESFGSFAMSSLWQGWTGRNTTDVYMPAVSSAAVSAGSKAGRESWNQDLIRQYQASQLSPAEMAAAEANASGRPWSLAEFTAKVAEIEAALKERQADQVRLDQQLQADRAAQAQIWAGVVETQITGKETTGSRANAIYGTSAWTDLGATDAQRMQAFTMIEKARVEAAKSQAELEQAASDANQAMAKAADSMNQRIEELTLSPAQLRQVKYNRELQTAADSGLDTTGLKTALSSSETKIQARSLQQVQGMMDEFDRRMREPAMGRFDKREADVLREYNDRIKDIREMQKDGIEGADELAAKLADWKQTEFNRIGREQSNDFAAGWAEGMRKWQDDVATGFENAKQLAGDTANAMSSTFSNVFFDAFTGNLKSAGEYFRSFCTDILRSISQMLAQQVTKAFISGLFGSSGSGGGIGTLLSGYSTAATGGASLTAGGVDRSYPNLQGVIANPQYSTAAMGAYADGGDYPANRLMLVGERGPELMLPRSSGTIIPNNALGGAPKITVNITNNTGSPVTSRTTVTQQDGETILGLVLDSARTDRGGFGSGMKSALGVT